MRNLLLAIIFLFTLTSQIFSQWIPQNSGTTNRFMTCFFLDDNLGWAAGNLGTIVKTTNGGQNWTSQSISTTDHIHSIFFTDQLNGWIVLYEFVPFRHGSIMHTTNGGDSWFTQLAVSGFSLHRIFLTNVNNGYALGSNGILFKTTNGGQSWNDISPFNSYWFYSAFFFNPNEGWVGGGLEGYLLRTINGGQNWSWIGLPTTERMMSLYFVSENYGWACGAGGKIIRTTNQGLDWLLSNSGVNVELRDIKFANQNEGWSVGLNGKILHSVDGGSNWLQQNSGTNSNLFGVHFSDELTGWVVGDNGIILKTNNGGVPVELSLFSYEIINNDVILSWSTATEINNQGFKVFRGENEIGYVPGSGTTTEPREYSFKDENVKAGTYVYELIQIDFDGTSHNVGELTVEVKNVPSDFMLEQNYPNPFNPSTNIKYSTAKDGFVTLTVNDLLGNEVERLVNDYQQAGHHNVLFNGTNLASGIYFYKLNVGEFTAVKKLILLK